MNMDPRLSVGGNNPPDPIDAINAQFESVRMEAENWLDGALVENEGQMKAVDALRADARQWRMALEAGAKSATAPLYDAYTPGDPMPCKCGESVVEVRLCNTAVSTCLLYTSPSPRD